MLLPETLKKDGVQKTGKRHHTEVHCGGRGTGRATNQPHRQNLTNYKFDVFLSHHFSPSSFTLLAVLTIMAGVLLSLWCSNSS